MKVLYFDCSSGISGNMTLGALSELIDDPHYLVNELKKLNVDGYHIHISKEKKNGITGTYVDVHLEHEHHHEHRNLFDVNKIIDESEIDEKAKDLAKRIFLRVAKAESKVHNETLENVHFHEVGAIDSIVDIIGTAILLCKINPDVIYSSVVNDGYGFIECAHGMISVPVPATSEIFAASNAITRQIDVDTELVTPTGAAIIAEIASEFTTMPAMNVQKVGWGTGTKDLVIPNVLKVSLGEIKKKTKL
ncbi:LarC family nickel insertion protein [Faecalibacillus intestinalis]|uniref:LarC family nickel insertion protein n=1 Tax=Faecalibacillus intestinalis TaxID=1982626 RepID=UPI003FEFEB90